MIKTCFNGGKRAFETERAAKRHRSRNAKGRLKTYLCPYCKYYHLTDSNW